MCCVLAALFLWFWNCVGLSVSPPGGDFGFAGLRAGGCCCVFWRRFLAALADGCVGAVRLFLTRVRVLALVCLAVLLLRADEAV
ncbi:DUF2237 family protein [Pacificibacter marinus]|uniref:DUF2237 family protein n=1 Tax=Pacificibacter marinus TaxID=658057 RepID=UPI00147BD912